MIFASHSLHPPVLKALEHRASALAAIQQVSARRRMAAAPPLAIAPPPSIDIPLTTVSLGRSFDAYVDVRPAGAPSYRPHIVDSGNSVLILPYWEDIAALPNAGAFQVLGQSPEPWGCPANVVRGSIDLPTADGGVHTIADCVFYACTGDNPSGEGRTANFAAACLDPWTASGWNNLAAIGAVLQAPLAYDPAYPFAEFDYAAADTVFAAGADPHVEASSVMRLHRALPAGYSMFPINKDEMWMTLTPVSLQIGDQVTGWPGGAASPIAVVDTGGTAAFLSDPSGFVYDKTWPDPVDNPAWTNTSTSCQSTSDKITIELGSSAGSYQYTIDTSQMPASVQGLTLVMCEENAFMMGRNGLNTGGVSALVLSILIDYAGSRVGFQAPAPG